MVFVINDHDKLDEFIKDTQNNCFSIVWHSGGSFLMNTWYLTNTFSFLFSNLTIEW